MIMYLCVSLCYVFFGGICALGTVIDVQIYYYVCVRQQYSTEMVVHKK